MRGLVAAPVAWLVGWLAGAGIGVSADAVEAAVTAVVMALLLGALHLAERRWPALARAVAWLGRELPKLAPTGPDGTPIVTTLPPTGQAGPTNVRRLPPATTGGGHPTGGTASEPAAGPQTPSGVSSANPPATDPK